MFAKIKRNDWKYVWRLTEGDIVHGFRLKLVDTNVGHLAHTWSEVNPRDFECFRIASGIQKENVSDESWSGESPARTRRLGWLSNYHTDLAVTRIKTIHNSRQILR